MSVNLTNQILLLEETRNLWEQFCKIAPPIDGFGPFGVTVVDVTRSFDDVLGLFRAANERIDDSNRITMSQLMPSADSLVSQLMQTMQTSQGNPAAIHSSVPNIAGWLWQLQNIVKKIAPIHDLVSATAEVLQTELNAKLSGIEEAVSPLGRFESSMQGFSVSVDETLKHVQNQAEETDRSLSAIHSVVESGQTLDRNLTSTKNDAEAHAKSVLVDFGRAKQAADDLIAGVATKDSLFSLIDEKLKSLENRNVEIHADLNVCVFQHLDPLGARELSTLIGVDDRGRAIWPNRLLKCRTQKSAVSVFETRVDSTLRLATSKIATRVINPCAIGKYAMSLDHPWFGRSIATPPSR